MTSTPTLSVVVPVRNGLPFLEQALDSALSQLPDDAELIVRDNMSTDGTSEWLRGIDDDRVRVITSEVSMSAGENWTAVCRAATGRWVKLLCADDFVLPGGLSRQLEAARTADAVMVASRRRIVDSGGATVMRSHGLGGLVGVFEGSEAIRRAMRSGTNPFGEPSSVLLRRDVLVDALPFTEDFPYLTDLDIYVKVLRHGRFVGLGTVDGGFRLSANSWSQELGNRQYREYRRWQDFYLREASVRLAPGELALGRARLAAKFLARRVVNSLAARRPPTSA